MAYEWTDGELITAEKLNNTGDCKVLIANLSVQRDDNDMIVDISIDKTYSEMLNAVNDGFIIYVKSPGISVAEDTIFFTLSQVYNAPSFSSLVFTNTEYFYIEDNPPLGSSSALTLEIKEDNTISIIYYGFSATAADIRWPSQF